MVFAQCDPRAESDFLHQIALLVYGGDSQIGSTEIDTDGEVGHNEVAYQISDGRRSP